MNHPGSGCCLPPLADRMKPDHNPATAMKITVDDWHFRDPIDATLVLDVFLDNGQHALMEVNAMRETSVVNGDIPEMIVFSELPGEKVQTQDCSARWVSRPPSKDCAWSNVEVPLALMNQIHDRLLAQLRAPA